MPVVALTIEGTLQKVNEGNVVIEECDTDVWSELGPSYWKRGVRKRVSGDRTECTVRFNEKTMCARRDKEIEIEKIIGHRVSIMATVKKYKFREGKTTNSRLIEGWTLTASNIQTI